MGYEEGNGDGGNERVERNGGRGVGETPRKITSLCDQEARRPVIICRRLSVSSWEMVRGVKVSNFGLEAQIKRLPWNLVKIGWCGIGWKWIE